MSGSIDSSMNDAELVAERSTSHSDNRRSSFGRLNDRRTPPRRMEHLGTSIFQGLRSTNISAIRKLHASALSDTYVTPPSSRLLTPVFDQRGVTPRSFDFNFSAQSATGYDIYNSTETDLLRRRFISSSVYMGSVHNLAKSASFTFGCVSVGASRICDDHITGASCYTANGGLANIVDSGVCNDNSSVRRQAADRSIHQLDQGENFSACSTSDSSAIQDDEHSYLRYPAQRSNEFSAVEYADSPLRTEPYADWIGSPNKRESDQATSSVSIAKQNTGPERPSDFSDSFTGGSSKLIILPQQRPIPCDDTWPCKTIKPEISAISLYNAQDTQHPEENPKAKEHLRRSSGKQGDDSPSRIDYVNIFDNKSSAVGDFAKQHRDKPTSGGKHQSSVSKPTRSASVRFAIGWSSVPLVPGDDHPISEPGSVLHTCDYGTEIVHHVGSKPRDLTFRNGTILEHDAGSTADNHKTGLSEIGGTITSCNQSGLHTRDSFAQQAHLNHPPYSINTDDANSQPYKQCVPEPYAPPRRVEKGESSPDFSSPLSTEDSFLEQQGAKGLRYSQRKVAKSFISDLRSLVQGSLTQSCVAMLSFMTSVSGLTDSLIVPQDTIYPPPTPTRLRRRVSRLIEKMLPNPNKRSYTRLTQDSLLGDSLPGLHICAKFKEVATFSELQSRYFYSPIPAAPLRDKKLSEHMNHRSDSVTFCDVFNVTISGSFISFSIIFLVITGLCKKLPHSRSYLYCLLLVLFLMLALILKELNMSFFVASKNEIYTLLPHLNVYVNKRRFNRIFFGFILPLCMFLGTGIKLLQDDSPDKFLLALVYVLEYLAVFNYR